MNSYCFVALGPDSLLIALATDVGVDHHDHRRIAILGSTMGLLNFWLGQRWSHRSEDRWKGRKYQKIFKSAKDEKGETYKNLKQNTKISEIV